MISPPLARKLRLPLGFTFGILYLLFARPTALSLLSGGLVALAGIVLRAWAAGHIVKNDTLATTGPYAHTRNPLYFGSFLIAAGFSIAAHWSLLLLAIAFFVLIYAPTIRQEEGNIRARFPEAYAQYERNVPAFMPQPAPWRGGEEHRRGGFDWNLYLRHREWRAALAFVAAVALLVLRMRWKGVP